MHIYKVTQDGKDLYYPQGAPLSKCLQSIITYIGNYMDTPPCEITFPEALDLGFRVVRVH